MTSGLAFRFVARMLYFVLLTRNVTSFMIIIDIHPGKAALNRNKNKLEYWSLAFWCGRWDADEFYGYIERNYNSHIGR